MGEGRMEALRVGFDGRVRLQFHGATVSTDAGLFPYRDLDEAARLTEQSAAALFVFRTGSNIRHHMTALLRQSVYSRLAGYEDTNDAERLSVDQVMRHVVGGRAVHRRRSRSARADGASGARNHSGSPATFRLICALRRSDHAGGALH